MLLLRKHLPFLGIASVLILVLTLFPGILGGRKHPDAELHIRIIESTYERAQAGKSSAWIPHNGKKPFFNKPSLYFLSGEALHAGLKTIAPEMTSARYSANLLSAIFSVLSLASLYALLLALGSPPRIALQSVAVTMSSLAFLFLARIPMLDLPLLMSLFLTLFCLKKMLDSPSMIHRSAFALTLGLGPQWKGPVFYTLLALPALVILVDQSKHTQRSFFTTFISFFKNHWKETLLGLLLGSSWVIVMSLLYGEKFLRFFFLREMFHRLVEIRLIDCILFLVIGLFPWWGTFGGLFYRTTDPQFQLIRRTGVALILGCFLTYLRAHDVHFHWMLPAGVGVILFFHHSGRAQSISSRALNGLGFSLWIFTLSAVALWIALHCPELLSGSTVFAYATFGSLLGILLLATLRSQLVIQALSMVILQGLLLYWILPISQRLENFPQSDELLPKTVFALKVKNLKKSQARHSAVVRNRLINLKGLKKGERRSKIEEALRSGHPVVLTLSQATRLFPELKPKATWRKITHSIQFKPAHLEGTWKAFHDKGVMAAHHYIQAQFTRTYALLEPQLIESTE